MNTKLIFGIVPVVLLVALSGLPGGFSWCDYLSSFEKTLDPSEVGSRIDSCLLCHINPAGGGPLNPYGTDFANNVHNFTIIEQLDSDGDGFTNIAEIHSRTFPGNASDNPVTSTLKSTLYGEEFYASNCQGCHEPLATSTKPGRTAAQIRIAINTVPAMSSLSVLSLANIQEIAKALAMSSTPASTLDGAALYASNCQGCHRPLATSTKRGRTGAQIQTSIGTVSGMSSLSSLSSDQILAIATALAVSPTSTPATVLDGAALYAGNCAGCHRPLISTAKPGRTADEIQNAIATVPLMNILSSLTSEQIQAIADALPESPTPTPSPTPSPASILDGAALYTSNCQGCHKPLATSDKRGATVQRINTGISQVSGMNSLTSLSSIQIQAIATALAVSPTPSPTSTTPAPTPTPTLDGATLYGNNCANCHGPLATSDKRGATVQRINTGISQVSGMSSLSSLTSAQIQAIVTALAVSPTPSPTPTPTPTPTPSLVSYSSIIQPIFSAYCTGCHGASSPDEGYSLTSYAGAMAGGRVVKFNATRSTLYQSVYGGDMPPSGYPPLPADSITAIKNWINQGALNN